MRQILIRSLASTQDELTSAEVYLPGFVWRELQAVIDCGVLDRGFVRVHCAACQKDRLVPFSCKVRGACSSCVGRKMCELTEHLLDHVLANVPVRQYVLTFPFPVRLLAARDPKLLAALRRIFIRAVSAFIHKRARAKVLTKDVRTGGLCVVQRAGSALNVNPHMHALFFDGAYTRAEHGELRFAATSEPTRQELQRLVETIATRCIRLLKRHGHVSDEQFVNPDADQTLPLFAEALSTEASALTQTQHQTAAVNHRGFNLHAAVRISADDLAGRKRLCRYILRPAIAQDRLSIGADGRVHYKMKRVFSDGRSVVTFTEHQFIRRIALLIPRPKTHEITYFGALASNAKWRNAIVPVPTHRQKPKSPSASAERPARASTSETKLPWAELIRRTFSEDLLVCPDCGARMHVIAAITQPDLIAKILTHLDLPMLSRPARRPRAPPLLAQL